MGLLIDKDLRAAATATPANIVTGIDSAKLNDSIRGCAINFRIGDIFIPGTDCKKPGSAENPRESAPLHEGETALIRTLEEFSLDDVHAAVVFPASRVSMQGLLMTNPGLVDPGYRGRLHVTVINMGREPYCLKRGDLLLRGIVFQLDSPVAEPYKAVQKSPVTQELLGKLSPDFLSVVARATSAAKKQIDTETRRGLILQFVLPLIATALTAIITYYATHSSVKTEFDERIKQLESM